MIASWVKVVWILIGGTVAAAGAAYVGGVFEPSPGSARVEAALQQPPAVQTGTGKEAAATDEASADMPSAGEDKAAEAGEQIASLPPAGETAEPEAPAATMAAEPEIVVPAFDLVRVEPDGSVVIAGRAAPNATVEVIAGATVIGTAESGASGDFAVVLEDPLKPGDYTVVLRSTTKDNIVASSAQTAIIAVPETESGQVLALVEEPGAPSRLITVPTAPQPAEEVAVKGDRPSTGSSEEMASAPEEKPETQAAAGEPASDTEKAAEVAEAEDTASADDQQMAAVEAPKAEMAKPAAETPAPPRVAVEAVEIEGRKVFVAGRADKGATVRVYANDILLGQVVSSEAGRFLIEAERDLPVGDYIVRADMLSAGNADVVARAAVPFEREPGENLAAVASQEPAASDAESKPAGTVMVDQDGADAATEEKAGLTGGMAAKDTGGETAKSQETEVAALDNDGQTAMTDTKVGDGAPQAAAPSDTPADSDTMEATAPKLQNVSGAVIIRRGDTLWQLSRRVYGRGVRYTTIYLANQGQIADPDMIWPGQVFSVPDETDEGEAADMSAVAEQVADPEDASEDVVTR
ncbi:MAG: Ig-like domain-containing protein [Rhizobiaceae bacterium]